jgi:hypothetical protein
MTRTILLALTLLASPARAGSWCSGIITANGDCLVTESPVIVRCDLQNASRSDPRCVGVADRRKIYDADPTVTSQEVSPPPRRHRERH